MKRMLLAFTIAFVAVPTSAEAGGGCHLGVPSEPEPANRVVIEHACFGPVVASVKTGTTVTWVNDSGIEHNITGPAIGFTELPGKATHAMAFNTPGIYVYACTIHPGMSGAVVVRDGAPESGAPAAAPAAAPVVAPVAAADDSKQAVPTAAGLAGAGVVALGVGALVVRRRRYT